MNKLSTEILYEIFYHLSFNDLLKLERVNRLFYGILSDDLFWKNERIFERKAVYHQTEGSNKDGRYQIGGGFISGYIHQVLCCILNSF